MTLRPWLALLVLALLVPSAFSQAKITFDPARDLDRFEEVSGSSEGDLFDLDEFRDLLSKEMDAAELDAVRERWRKALEKGQAEVDKLRADPAVAFRHRLRRSLSSSGFFRSHRFRPDLHAGAWTILVQQPGFKGRADDSAAIRDLYGPWLEKVSAVFDTEIAVKLGLTRRPDYGGLALIVLDGEQALADYMAVSDFTFSDGERAVYDSRLRAIVTHSDRKAKQDDKALTFPVLSMAVQALLHAHFQGVGEILPETWLSLGLANYLAYTRGTAPASLDRRDTPDDVYRRLAALVNDETTRPLVLYTPEEMADIRDVGKGVLLFVQSRSKKSENDLTNDEFTRGYVAFCDESTAWVQFLFEGSNGKYRRLFESYLTATLKTSGDREAVRASFASVAKFDLERDFWTWTLDHCRKIDPRLGFDQAFLDGLFQSAAALRIEETERAFRPTVLALAAEEVDARRGLALAFAERGDLAGALTVLKDLSSSDSKLTERIARDRQRINGALALRDALVAWAPSQKLELRLADGNKRTATVSAIDDGVLVFATKPTPQRVPIASLPPSQIVAWTQAKESRGSAPPWSRAFVSFLAGEEKWAAKLPSDETPDSRALRQDADDSKSCLALGRIAAAIDELSKVTLPLDGDRAAHALARLETLSQARTMPLVASRRAALKTLASVVLREASAGIDVLKLMKGRVTKLDGDRLRLEYLFDDKAEIEDFIAAPTSHELLEMTGREKMSWKMPAIAGGALWISEPGWFRHRVSLQSPMSVTVELKVSLTREMGELAGLGLDVTLCDDLERNALVVSAGGSVLVIDGAKGRAPGERQQITLDEKHVLKVVHDGKSVRAYVNGKDGDASPVGTRTQGALGFLAIAGVVRITLESLTIEGQMSADGAGVLRKEWVASKLAMLGF